MDFPKNKWFKCLVFLHILGLLSIPDYYETKWKNSLHRHVYRNGIFLLLILMSLCQFVLTFGYAVFDLAQFLQRLIEFFAILTCVLSAIVLNNQLPNTLKMLHMMDAIFVYTDKAIAKKYRIKERRRIRGFFAIAMTLCFFTIVDALLPSKETVALMARLYHRTEPVRLFPLMIWVPLIDTNDKTNFMIIYAVELYWTFLLAWLGIQIMLLAIVFTLALTGQFEMLNAYVKLVGKEHWRYGNLIQYTDLVHGKYRTVKIVHKKEGYHSPVSLDVEFGHSLDSWSKNNQILIIAEGKQPMESLELEGNLYEGRRWMKRTTYLARDESVKYEGDFIRQILVRQQELMLYLNLFYSVTKPMMNVVILPVIGMGLITVYQLSIASHLTLLTTMKMVVDFIVVGTFLINITNEGERVQSCNDMIAQSLYESHWYLLSIENRKKVLFMLQFSQRVIRTKYFWGLVEHSRNFGLKIYKTCYTVAIFLRLKTEF